MKIAIFGSGPSGFYAAEELLIQSDRKFQVDMFDRLPTPYGLVRGGVAPDHQKIKSVVKVYEKTAAREGFRFFGNVEFGRDILLEDVKKLYDAVLFAVGAKSDRKMGIPGEHLGGSFAATEFVGWYNGHPDYQDLRFDLSCEKAAVIGIGNVAIDVARILARDPDTYGNTDITDQAVKTLKASKVREIYLIGRRGPVQSAFTNPEIRELAELPGADLIVDPEEIELDELSKADLESGKTDRQAKGNVDVLTEQSKKDPAGRPRRIVLKFLASPVELIGKDGKVSAVRLEKNELFRDDKGTLRPKGTGRFETVEAGLVLRSIGYKGVPIAGIPFDDKKGTIPNVEGRVVDSQFKAVPGLYVVGWAKRGPSGVIGTNKPDSIDTVHKIMEDVKSGRTLSKNDAGGDVADLIKERKIQAVSFADWKKLDELEIARGRTAGKAREKFKTISAMLESIKDIG